MQKTVSIIIPCRNEEKYIARCLDSIINCDYDRSLLTVFVCDGKSTDSTVRIIKDYEKKHPFIRLIVNEKMTTPFALNAGIKASTADVRFILGAHAEIFPDYISQSIKTFEIRTDIGCTGGLLTNVFENPVSEAVGKAMSSSFGVGDAHFRTGTRDGYVDTVGFGAYKKEVFEKAGYFDEELIRNQDDEFNFRIGQAGYRIYLNRAIRYNYYVRASFVKLFKQYYQYGFWKVYVNKKHRTITTVRQLIPFFFVLFILSGGILSFLNRYIFLAYSGVLGLYFLLAFISSIAKSRKPLEIIRIVFSFLILHFSYGMGYLEGFLNFILLRKKIPEAAALTR